MIVGFAICIFLLTIYITECNIEYSSNFLLVFTHYRTMTKITMSKTLKISEFRFLTIETWGIEFLWLPILDTTRLILAMLVILFIIFPLKLHKFSYNWTRDSSFISSSQSKSSLLVFLKAIFLLSFEGSSVYL